MYDVIVVGGGPAGSTCAWFLGQHGLRVLLVERSSMPRAKVCGDGWGFRRAVPLLQRMGVLDQLASGSYTKIHGLLVVSPDGSTIRVDIPQDGHPFAPWAITCPRHVLDDALWRHAGRCVTTQDAFEVIALLRDGDRVVGIIGQDRRSGQVQRIHSRVVVGADGARSRIAQQLGLHIRPESQAAVGVRAYYRGVSGLSDHVELFFLRSLVPGYLWVFPLGPEEANVGLVAPPARMPSGGLPEQRLERCFDEHPSLRARLGSARRLGPVHGWILPARDRIPQVAWDGALLIGDAAGLIDPWLWEGLGNALWSAEQAAEVIAEAIGARDCSRRTLTAYTTRLRRVLEPELRRGARLQRWASRPWLLNGLVRAATRIPRIRQRLSAGMVAPAAHAGLEPATLGWSLFIEPRRH